MALVIQHELRMRYIVNCSLPHSTIFFHISHKRHDFRKKVTEPKMCVLSSSTNLSGVFLILRRNDGDTIKNVYRSSSQVPVILVRF